MKRPDDTGSLRPVQQLANAIIVQAAEDYRESLRKLKINPKHRASLRMKHDCESFFRSDWFLMMTNVDATYLIRKLKEEANEHDE